MNSHHGSAVVVDGVVIGVVVGVVVGVVGGIASGKSHVTRVLEECGAKVISADAIAHDVLREPEMIDLLVSAFGQTILSDAAPLTSQTIDRRKLGAMVFGPSEEKIKHRKRLESIVHPRIRQIARTELQTLKATGQVDLIVLDAPLLIEGGWLPYCDRVLFVDTPDATRQRLAMARGWSEQEWRVRESAQVSLEEKRKVATDILSNDGTLIELEQRVREFAKHCRGKP